MNRQTITGNVDKNDADVRIPVIVAGNKNESHTDRQIGQVTSLTKKEFLYCLRYP